MTDPGSLQDARLIDLFDHLLTSEARMAALGKLGADYRAELNRRGAEIVERDGMAPTWRAPEKLGTISYSTGTDSVVVTDPADFASWVAEQHPEEVTATITVPARLLESALEAIRQCCHVGAAGIETELTVRSNWQKVFLAQHTTVIERDQICNAAGEVIPGLGQRFTGRAGVSVRVHAEAKERAIAELGDPMALAVLTAPLGQVVAAHVEEVPDDAIGEPDDGPLPDVPLDPVGAAEHAVRVQGGFSTPAIEAFRILGDALRTIRVGGRLDARWRAGVADTLDWLNRQVDPQVDAEEARFAAQQVEDWRAVLAEAVLLGELRAGVLKVGSPLTDLRTWCRKLSLPVSGTKAELFQRLVIRIGSPLLADAEANA